jgi:hypothetical protein
MTSRSDSKPVLKAPVLHDARDEHRAAGQDELQRPRNTPPNKFPIEGFSVEVDGKMKSQYATEAAAVKAGSELKGRFPVLQVKIYDAAAKSYSLIEAPK